MIQILRYAFVSLPDTGGGHGGNALEDAADLVAFIAGQLGLTVPEAMAQP